MDTLLGENGCPWDRAQTHKSLRPHLLEESYEVADAIDNDDMAALSEELGDLLLQVILHSRIAEKEDHFTLGTVIDQLAEKLIRRHTHIFASDVAQSAKSAEETWEANKMKEKSISTPLENMEAVPKALPALIRTQKVIKRSGQDFDLQDIIEEMETILQGIKKEINKEIKKDIKKTIKKETAEYKGKNGDCEDEEIFGKFLFLTTALFAKMQLNAEFSLTNATLAFINSFR